ncbi:peroxisomal N(1)-acetyl-spermine/spermidine oxidase [Halyomorpha halys]|uniref:peroxisomal N(1)-acetyl-spermine/spermidine oxidase n=1 Tax=Halyomorpha halys TaxID=286706 RepID=UPI0006D5024E|nr:protein anon-37Cs [Halyomorpha halys]
MTKVPLFGFIKKEFKTLSTTIGWNACKHSSPSGGDGGSDKKGAPSSVTCKEVRCQDVKCIPPSFASCTAEPKKNICSPTARTTLKPCKIDKPDPGHKMAETPADKGPRVIILGAGFSGLTAADRLIKGGHTNLVVLEADCRAGGRLKSQWAGDTVVELGLKMSNQRQPSWDHPLMQLGLSSGIFAPPVGADPSAGLLSHPLPLPLIFKTYVLLSQIIKEELCLKRPKGYIGLRFKQAGSKFSRKYQNQIARILAAATSLMGPKLQVEENSFGAFAIAPGGVKVPLGASGLLMPLLESVGPDRILYKKEAVSIRWGTVTLTQKPRVIVRCRDGVEYPGEFVIISCSLGSLKGSMDSMFYPPLPTKKAAAIQNIGFEQQNVAYLVFDDPIWIWSQKPVDMKVSKKEDKEKWPTYVKEIKQVTGSQHVIGVSVTGPGAVKMERVSKKEILCELHRMIEEGLNVKDIPMPKDVVRSGWSGVRYYAGSHSVSDSAQQRADLAAPLPSPDQLPPILLFAGEATCPPPGVRAAFLSGLREAERLLSIFSSMPKAEPSFICPEPCPEE